MKSEEVNYYSKEGKLLGKIERSQAEAEHRILGAVIVFVFTPTREVWLQFRPAGRVFGGRFDSTGSGAVQAGEAFEATALRELEEESGITAVSLVASEPFLNTFPDQNDHEIHRWSQLFICTSEEEPRVTDETAGFIRLPLEIVKEKMERDPLSFVPQMKP